MCVEFQEDAKYLETILEVVVLLQESSVVDNDLCIRDAKLQYFIINSLGGIDCSNRLLQVNIEGPKLDRFE
jgi:hypothetical protein